ncbi:MAG: hypothetical protein HRT88_15370 [Lentisphaeraceae bacterium]|nr:hypothetical protein [Lentisphaeraceae bacterium]
MKKTMLVLVTALLTTALQPISLYQQASTLALSLARLSILGGETLYQHHSHQLIKATHLYKITPSPHAKVVRVTAPFCVGKFS